MLNPRGTGLPGGLISLAMEIHMDNIAAGWWKKDANGTTIPRDFGNLLALVHSEISEADHGWMGALMDDKVPHRTMFEVELADTAIRTLDILGFCAALIPEMKSTTSPLSLEGSTHGDWIRLMHRCTTDALEGFRKGHLRNGVNGLIDLLTALHWAAIRFRLDLVGAIESKRRYNAVRSDHKPENRAAEGGKKW